MFDTENKDLIMTNFFYMNTQTMDSLGIMISRNLWSSRENILTLIEKFQKEI